MPLKATSGALIKITNSSPVKRIRLPKKEKNPILMIFQPGWDLNNTPVGFKGRSRVLEAKSRSNDATTL